MGAFYFQGGSVLSDPIDVEGPGEVEVGVAVLAPPGVPLTIGIEETRDSVCWASSGTHAIPDGETVVRLSEDPARKFMRVRLDGGGSGMLPASIHLWIRRVSSGHGRDSGMIGS